jgi:protein-S-isoprenylcysteine O-methyltransferase Ste14
LFVLALVLLNTAAGFGSFSGLPLLSWLLWPALAWRRVCCCTPPLSEADIEKPRTRSRAYRYIRHPLYCSLLLLGQGVRKIPHRFAAARLLAVPFSLLWKKPQRQHSARPTRLQARTKMFIPFWSW